jgi:putative ABC transport system permease protein
MPGIVAADPLVVLPSVTVQGPKVKVLVHIIGTVPGGMGAPRVTHGRAAATANEAVVDVLTHLHLGQTFSVAGHDFHVVGVVSGYSYFAGTPSTYVTVAGAQAVAFGGRPDITALAIRGKPQSVPRQVQLLTRQQAYTDLLRVLQNGLQSIDIITAFLWIVAVVIIGAVVYLSALERRQDFAVLKAIGSSTGWLYGGLALQAGVIAVVSGLLAIAIEPLLEKAIPMSLSVPASALWLVPPVAIVIGLLASLSGLRPALRADPALAFGSK